MANVDVSVLESDGVTTKTVRTLDFGRQAAAASKSLTLSTEDKAVLDAIATSLATLDNVTQTTAAPTGADTALVVGIHPDSQNANGQATMANSAPVAIASDQSAIPVNATAVASEVHVGEVGGKTAVVSVTLSTDTSAYGSGDLIADTQQIDAFFRKADGTGVINSITIIDEDNQGAAFYIVFMSTNTSLGTENSAPNISDANLTAGLLGIIAVATSDYVTLSGAKVATIKNIGLPVKAVSGTDDIYIGVLNATGTPTYTASGLEMRIGVLLD